MISARWIYFLNVIDGVHTISEVLTFAAGIWWVYNSGDAYERNIANTAKKMLIIMSIPFVISLIALLFIPTKETLIAMKISEYATKENLDMTAETMKQVVDYIVDAIRRVKGS